MCTKRTIKNNPTCEASKSVVVPNGFNIRDYSILNYGTYSKITARIKPGTLYWRGISILYIETTHGHDNSINGQKLILDVADTNEAASIMKAQNGRLNKVLIPGVGNIDAKLLKEDNRIVLKCELPIF